MKRLTFDMGLVNGSDSIDNEPRENDMMLSSLKQPLIMAHRGFQTHYPENTLVSFNAALEAGAQLLELDVTLTRDGQVVVLHDDTVDRTTNGIGPVNRYLLKDLKQLDAGSWFDSRFAGERIPTLNEVQEQFAGRTCLNIEIKSHDQASNQMPYPIEKAVLNLVSQRKETACVLISSFDPDVLTHVKELDPAINVAYISKYFKPGETVALCKKLNAFSYHPNLSFLDLDHVKTMHREGIRVFPYNIDSKDEIFHAFSLGVDGLISKNPPLARLCLSNVQATV